MRKVTFLMVLGTILVGLGLCFYINSMPVKFNIVLANGDKMRITYEEFDKDYTMKNNLEVFYGAKFTFKDKVKSVENASIEDNKQNEIVGSLVRFDSGMTLFVSKANIVRHDEKMQTLQVGKTVKVTTYFTEKSNSSLPMPVLMPYMDFDNLYYDYSKLIVE